MKLSVIIPVYQTEETMAQCVESVLSQSFSDFEVILVDDGASDICRAKCDFYTSVDSRVKVIHKENGGLSDARNAGMDVAQGDWMTFVDSDDYLSAGTFEAVMDAIGREPRADMVEYPLVRYEGRKDESRIEFSNRIYTDIRTYWLSLNTYLHTYACNKVFRRTMMHDIRFPYGKKFEDAWMLPQLLAKNPVVMTIDQGLYNYTWNQGGITVNADGGDMLSLLEAQLNASDVLGISLLDADCAKWYMNLLNIQIFVCRKLHITPILPYRRLPLSAATTMRERMKVCVLNVLGFRSLLYFSRINHS